MSCTAEMHGSATRVTGDIDRAAAQQPDTITQQFDVAAGRGDLMTANKMQDLLARLPAVATVLPSGTESSG